MITPSRLHAVAVAVALIAAVSRADTASEAELHYSLGLELYKQRKYEEALQHLVASNRLVPNANVVFNVGQIYGLLHRDAEAFNWYETYLGFATLDEAGRARGKQASDALLPRVAVVDVTSTPTGAELFIDRVDLGSVGFAPRRIAVAPGAHTVLAQLKGFHEGRGTVNATVGTIAPLALELTPIRGKLVVESTPAGATVRREGTQEVLGVTPLSLELPLGELRVEIELDGYVEQQRSATVREEAETRVKVDLVRAASRVSILSVQGEPEGARVRLDEREVGTVPVVLSGLEPGSFQLTVEAPGREPWGGRITLEPGAATRVDARLAVPGGGPLRNLRWGGYGLGAAATIAGLITAASAIGTREAFFANPSSGLYRAVQVQNVTADVLVIGGLVTLGATLLFDLVFFKSPQTHAEVNVVR